MECDEWEGIHPLSDSFLIKKNYLKNIVVIIFVSQIFQTGKIDYLIEYIKLTLME